MYLPDGVSLNRLEQILREMSWEVADTLISYSKDIHSNKEKQFKFKVIESDEGPVTSADLAANQIIIHNLNQEFTDIDWCIVSEETIKKEPHVNLSSKDWVWMIDPLDGTKDYIQGTGEYAVHIALLYKRSPVIGVVLIPEREELWFGFKNDKAWYEDRLGRKTFLEIKQNKQLDSMVSVSSKNHSNNDLQKILRNLNFKTNLHMGSVGYKVASILRGDTDIYLSISGKTAPKDWDMAAPYAIIKAAGGEFTNSNGNNLVFLKNKFLQEGVIVASLNKNHQNICSLIREEEKVL
tara:strand:- start:1286 stop:2167 length:882 start_codon:yes stop_codon:yes gene_type:complete